MARRGGFGGALPSLRPYGNLGAGFTQYQIGQTAKEIAETRRYAIEVAWSNGQASNAEYLQALQEELDATDPNTRERISAQNKIDDARYTIGRDLAQSKNDPEALISFDQAALAKMTPGTPRYNDVKRSLDAELANRRSTAYGKLVDQYQAGSLTTPALLAWVKTTLSTLPADAPDRNQWTSTAADLQTRVEGESDDKVFQDYQFERITPKAFLAYIKHRRDQYLPGSNLYAQWDRKLEDSVKQVTAAGFAKADNAFFARYERGRVDLGDPDDAAYLNYLRTRVAGMKPDDPDRLDWENKLDKAVYGMAEDRIRLEVAEDKRPASDLVSFYRHYQTTLNPNSTEWRSIQGKIDEAQRADFSTSQGMIEFKVANNLLPPTALVDFWQRRISGLPPGSSDWLSAQDHLRVAKDNARSVREQALAFNAAHPESPIPVPAEGAKGPTFGYTSGAGGPGAGAYAGGSPARGPSTAGGGPAGATKGNVERAASVMLKSIGAPDTVGNRQAMMAWMAQEGTSSSFARNNPLNLHANPGTWAGQTGSKYVNQSDQNVAVFGSLDAGVAANAANLVNLARSHPGYGYQQVIDAFKNNNPRAALDALAASSWSASRYGTKGGGSNNLYRRFAEISGGPPPGEGGTTAPATTGYSPGPAPDTSGGFTNVPPPARGPAGPTERGVPGVTDTHARTALDDLITFYEGAIKDEPKGSPRWQDYYNRLQDAKASRDKIDTQAVGPKTPGKAIDPKADISVLEGQLRINAGSSPYAIANYDLNHDSITNAWSRGDRMWLYSDPSTPNATTYLRDADGEYVLGSDGKRVLVRGSGYRPVSDEDVARVEAIRRDYYLSLAETARVQGQNKDAASFQNKAIESSDKLRGIDNKIARAHVRKVLEGDGATHNGLFSDIEQAWANGDMAAVYNGTQAALDLIRAMADDPNIDEATRSQFEDKAAALANNPLFPDPVNRKFSAIDPGTSISHRDANGRVIYDDIGLAPGSHLVFVMEGGKKTFAVKNEDDSPPGDWNPGNHVKVHVKVGDRVVTAEAPVKQNAPVNPTASVTVDGKPRVLGLGETGAIKTVSFFDGSGLAQTAYTLDGVTWIRTNSGSLPQLQIKGDYTAQRNPETGEVTYYSRGVGGPMGPAAQVNRTASFTTDASGSVITNISDPALLGWHGADLARDQVKKNPFSNAAVVAAIDAGASVDTIRGIVGAAAAGGPVTVLNVPGVGGPGQSATVATAAPDGSINMLPPGRGIRPDWSPTGGFNPVNDLLGKTEAEIIAKGPSLPGKGADPDIMGTPGRTLVGIRAAAGYGVGPGAPPDALATITRQTGLDLASRIARPGLEGPGLIEEMRKRSSQSSLSLTSQLPPDTPARYDGAGLDPPKQVPVRPLPPAPKPSITQAPPGAQRAYAEWPTLVGGRGSAAPTVKPRPLPKPKPVAAKPKVVPKKPVVTLRPSERRGPIVPQAPKPLPPRQPISQAPPGAQRAYPTPPTPPMPRTGPAQRL